MTEMTMQQELDMLRKELEELKKKKLSNSGDIKKNIEEKAKELKDSTVKIKDHVKDNLDGWTDIVKHDFTNISPITAVLIFAAGVILGRASK
jgi:ElaB/YqjD/DUF883 family membrane-anchored ribosome-binding protein